LWCDFQGPQSIVRQERAAAAGLFLCVLFLGVFDGVTRVKALLRGPE
jgi:hypothetical protein